jgi:Tfp pilus assembly PilM family ATPase
MWTPIRRAHLVGLDIGADAVRAVVLGRSRGRWLVRAVGERLFARGPARFEPEDPLVASAATAKLLLELGLRRAPVAAALPISDAVLYRCTFPAMPSRKLGAAIRNLLANRAPFGPEPADMVWKAQRRKGLDGHVDVVAVMARRSAVDECAAMVAQAGHELSVLDVPALALANAYTEIHGASRASALVVNVGERFTTFCRFRAATLAGCGTVEASYAQTGGVAAALAAAVRAGAPDEPHLDACWMVPPRDDSPRTAQLLGEMRAALGAPVELFDPMRELERAPGSAGADLRGGRFALAAGLAVRRKGDA